ncbi:MAG: GntR family transcriptional regulator [Desulfobacterales bacterium]|nr:GntR family transcriptional regulator [Desulfobacterales bacterium]
MRKDGKDYNMTSRAIQTLREKIIVGELKPGYKLNELDISVRLGISRPPLREALRMLEKEHLVVNVPRKGTYVSELSLRNFLEVTQTREMVECYCISLLKASNIRTLPKVENAFKKALALPLPSANSVQGMSIKHIRMVLDFHLKLVESIGNTMLNDIYTSIGYTLARYQYIYFHLGETTRHSLDDHRRILDLVGSGSFEQAEAELRKHIGYTVDLVKNRILHRAVF